jgi:CubicO group peptidase (beta-lactamase class C family)
MSLTELDSYLAECTSRKEIPGCVCWAGNQHETFFSEKYGYAQITPQNVFMKKDTVFDLASLTKPIATALSIMILHEKHILKIGGRLGETLSVFKNTGCENTTITQLLTHTSGLPAWYPTYLIPEDDRLQRLADLATGKQEVVYSCLGYILLGKVIEQVSGIALDRFLRQNITEKLGLNTLRFGPVSDTTKVAPTEKGNGHEQKMAEQYGDISGIKWRRHLLQGEVHDGNAFYGFQGVAGNAGLFSNIEDLVRFTRAYLAGEIISSDTLALMTKDHTGGEEKRNLGWRVEPYPGVLSPTAFGHTGFTGTMLLVDPQQDLIIILLANAVHPKVQLRLMNPIREDVVRIIASALHNH